MSVREVAAATSGNTASSSPCGGPPRIAAAAAAAAASPTVVVTVVTLLELFMLLMMLLRALDVASARRLSATDSAVAVAGPDIDDESMMPSASKPAPPVLYTSSLQQRIAKDIPFIIYGTHYFQQLHSKLNQNAN